MKTERVTREGDRETRGQEIGNHNWRDFWELHQPRSLLIVPYVVPNKWLFSVALEQICIAVPGDLFPLTYSDQPTKGTAAGNSKGRKMFSNLTAQQRI